MFEEEHKQTALDATLESELNTPNENPTEGNGNETPVEGNQEQEVSAKVEPEIDYKEKFSASSRENQRILAEKQRTDQKIATLTKEEIPTNEEMAEITPNWDLLTDFEQQQAIKIEHTARITRAMRSKQLESEESEKWEKDLRQVVKDNPEITGSENEFKDFCYQPKNSQTPIDILASAFLHNKAKTNPTKPIDPKDKFTALDPAQNPSGGSVRVTPMTDDEAEKIRKTDPDRYKELLKKGILK